MKKMKTTPLSIDTDTFKQMLAMSSADMTDLIETIGICASLNKQLNSLPKEKIMSGICMIHHAVRILKQCECNVIVSIDHRMWDDTVTYDTTEE